MQPDFRSRCGRRLASATACAVLITATCNDPQSPAPASDLELRGRFVAGTLELQVEDPSGAALLQLVATNLEFDPQSETLAADVALRNAGSASIPGPSSVVVSHIDPPTVHTLDALCGDPCPGCAIQCSFDHAGSYGDDGELSPGETSEPRRWRFAVPGGTSFAFRARIAVPDPGTGIVAGRIFLDENANGTQEPGEPPLPGRPVQLEFGDAVQTTVSDARGRFEFDVETPGLYVLQLVPTDFCLETTPPRLQVIVVRLPDGSLSRYDGARFGCRGDAPPDSSVAAHGVVFRDVNRNGVQDRGETGVRDVLIVGSMPTCPTFAPIETRTNADGAYRLQLPACPPPYMIHREPLVGYDDTTPNPVVFDGPAQLLRADFGIVESGDGNGESFIDGVVFRDADGDGEIDRGEAGIPDVTVTASGLLCANPVVVQVQTDANGRYRIRGSAIHCPPPWIVQQAPPSPDGCATTPNPVILRGAPGEPPTIHRADFGFGPCPPATP